MSSVQTTTGQLYQLTNPQPDQVRLFDIAHALSQQCRFAGHTREFYSVAQHSVLVSYLIEPEYALLGLLHDAPEAYVIDLPSPIKAELHHSSREPIRVVRPVRSWPVLTKEVPGPDEVIDTYSDEYPDVYAAFEGIAFNAIYDHLRLPYPSPEAIKALKVADELALRHEATAWLQGGPAHEVHSGQPWCEPLLIKQLENATQPWNSQLLNIALEPRTARRYFLLRLYELTKLPEADPNEGWNWDITMAMRWTFTAGSPWLKNPLARR